MIPVVRERTLGTAPNHPTRIRGCLARRKQPFFQTLAETFRQLDSLFVSQQLHDIPQAIEYSLALITALKVFLDPNSELWREIVLHVIGQHSANLRAISMKHGLRDTNTSDPSDVAKLRKGRAQLSFLRQLSFETFSTLPNPTAT